MAEQAPSNEAVLPNEENLVDLVRGLIATMEIEADKNEQVQSLLDVLSSGGTVGDAYGLNEQDLEVVYSMALTCYNNHKFDDAKMLFKFLCFMDNTQEKFWMGLGATQQMLKDYQAAVDAFSYCTLLDVENPKPQLQAGYCLMSLGKQEEAVYALEGAVMAAADDAQIKMQAETLLASIETQANAS